MPAALHFASPRIGTTVFLQRTRLTVRLDRVEVDHAILAHANTVLVAGLG